MKFFRPDFYFKLITDIPLSLLEKFELSNIRTDLRCILMDVDETIAPRNCPELLDGVREWLDKVLKIGIKIILVSNNCEKRVKTVADALNLPFVCSSLKPMPFGIKKAIKMMQCKKEASVLIGDQIFTDILGANLCGIKSILVDPIIGEKNTGTMFSKIKRLAEKPLRKNLSELYVKIKT